MTLARPIGEFFETPSPDCAVLLAKGPSLDLYDPSMAPAGAFVMGLNEVPLVLPCDGVVYADGQMDHMKYPESCEIFRHQNSIEAHGGRGYYFHRPVYGRKVEPHMMTQYGAGIASRAITILGLWGVKRIVAWGLNAYYSDGEEFEAAGRLSGLDMYAKCVQPVCSPKGGGKTGQHLKRLGDGVRRSVIATGVMLVCGWCNRDRNPATEIL